MLRPASRRIGFLSLVILLAPFAGSSADGYRTPSPALAAIVDAPLPPAAVLSPDRKWLLLLDRPDAPPIAELAQPELRLAGLRVNPSTNGPSRATHFTGLALQPLAGGAARRIAGLPAGVRIANYEWSRDARHLAFVVVAAEGLELWLAAADTATARRLTGPILNAMLGDPLAWLDDATLLIRRVPPDRGAVPAASTTPTGPVVQENLGKRAPARTYDGLLASPHDEALFEHYGASELALVKFDGRLTPLSVRGLLTFVAPSPDGQHVIVSQLKKPFSYLVPSSRFPTTVAVYDRAGRREHLVVERALSEGTATEAVTPGPRSVTWRADAPATLSWVQSLPRGTTLPDKKTIARDAWFTLAAPFAAKPTEQQRFEYRVSGVQWSDDTLALVTESWTTTRTARTWSVSPGKPQGERTLLAQRHTEDRYADPGRPVTGRDARGRIVVQRSADGKKIFLTGAGASAEGDRPFLDELDLATKATRRVWRSAPPHYEEFVAFADAALTRAVVARESPAEPTNYFVRTLATGGLTPLTAFPNPYPQLTGAKQEVIRYQRADGVALSGTLHLPPGWTPASGPLPTLLWAYPREFQSEEAASQVKATPERFARVSATGPLPFLLAGYAVLNDPAMPIVAKKGQRPNDSYVAQLIASAQAAVDELVRRGVADPKRIAVAGHSYGAFMTANLLAHSDLFRAGIARSGAYNRTLTPFGFQSERRNFWEAPAVYAAMSPFNFADKVNEPLLLIHGAADNNSGTFPIQSERFYAALKGHGATTRLTLLPHEAHGYRARESLLHMLWEMETWLDTHVKSAAKK
ncbi:MAG: prolyl oligopeptidase family serine peptidase [Opitutaceae bacterium]|nr:prolyl oligopeptidase family serine peptidase [Opitutaceae bacterium]